MNTTNLELIQEIVAFSVVAIGIFFTLTGSIGMLRFKDFFSRLHPAGITDSAGVPLVLLGLIIKAGFTLLSLKLLILMFLVIITSPTACHALAKSAFYMANKDKPTEKPAKKRKKTKTTAKKATKTAKKPAKKPAKKAKTTTKTKRSVKKQ